MGELNLDKKILVVGCGGLGCSVVENLIRLGVKSIAVCDGDTFDESNLNRQLYATPKTIGKNKARMAKKRAKKLEYEGEFIAYEQNFDEATADEMLAGVDIVIDALDNVVTRLYLEDKCEQFEIPLVHGAVCEWVYQVSVVKPGQRLLHRLFEGYEKADTNVNYAFTVSMCAAKEVAEAMLLAMGQPSDVENKLFLCDLQDNLVQIVNI